MDATFWAFVALVLFVGLVIRFGGIGLLCRALSLRGTRIQTELDQAAALRKEAEDLLAACRVQNKKLEDTIQAITQEAQEDADLALEALDEQLSDLGDFFTRTSEEKIRHMRAQVAQEVRDRLIAEALLVVEERLSKQAPGLSEKMINAALHDLPRRLPRH